MRTISDIDTEVGLAAETSLEFTVFNFRLSEDNEFVKIHAEYLR